MKFQNMRDAPPIFKGFKDKCSLSYHINNVFYDMEVRVEKTRKNSKLVLRNKVSNVETTWRDFADLQSYLWVRGATDIEVN